MDDRCAHPSPVAVELDVLERVLFHLLPCLVALAVFQLAHDGERHFLADDDAVAPELAVDPAVSVTVLVKIEPFRDEALQGLSLDLRVGFPPLHAVVVFGFGYVQNPACLPDGAELAPMLFEEFAPHAWS